jgi:hypothetical protein
MALSVGGAAHALWIVAVSSARAPARLAESDSLMPWPHAYPHGDACIPGFSELLDRVECGETIRITRAGHGVAELRPVTSTTGRALRAAAGASPLSTDTG